MLSLAGIAPNKYFKGNDLLKTNGADYAMLEYMGGGCPDAMRRPIKLGIKTDNYAVTMSGYLSKSFDDMEIEEIYDLNKDPDENNNLSKKKNIKDNVTRELKVLELRFNDLKKQYSR